MGFKIVWTLKAVKTFEKRIAYLEKHWTSKEISAFTNRVNIHLNLLKQEPFMFPVSARAKEARISVIIKQVSLVYKVKSTTKEIQLIAFIDNRQRTRYR